MTAIKTELGPQTQAEKLPFSATQGLPRTNVWDAIIYVKTTLEAALQSVLSGPVTTAQYTADDARGLAITARGEARRAKTAVQKIDDVQIALKAQVFN